MKTVISLLFILLFVSSFSVNSQTRPTLSKCRNIYVWDFMDQDKKKNRTTNDVTEAVEEALTNIDECFVLQRRNLASLANHAAAEKGINSIREMKYDITHALSGSGAKLVLFGIVDMSARDAYEIKLRIEDLTTSRIVTAKSTRILASEISNIDQRNKAMYKLVCNLVGILYIESPVRANSNFTPNRSSNYASQGNFNTIRANDANLPRNISNRMKFTLSPKSGLELIPGDCVGNAYKQTVTVSFTFVNTYNPNLRFHFPYYHAFATDEEGNQYDYSASSLGGEIKESQSSNDKDFYTGTKLRASISFRNVLPGVKKMSVVNIRFAKQVEGSNAYVTGDITFRDLVIDWR